MPPVPPFLIAALLGVLLAACGVPLPWSFLSPVPLAFLLAYVAKAGTPRQAAARMWWAGSTYSAVHLWWLTAFLSKLFGTPVLGVLAFALYALEGAFFALMAWLVARLFRSSAARVWGLAGGWVILEWLRFLGPLAFPWPTLGYTLLPTPAMQIADLGGVLLGSVLVIATAASFVGVRWGSRWPHRIITFAWLVALAYGITRVPGQGPVQPMLVLRTDFDSFGRASRQLTPEQQLEVQRQLSAPRAPGEIVVWSETALTAAGGPTALPVFPGPGISGLGTPYGEEPHRNSVVGVAASGQVTARNEKAKLVPFGEYFPLYRPLHAAYGVIEQAIGFELPAIAPARQVRPLSLDGVRYGAYICYDSVFPWVARRLVRQGAQVLVNPSNDGWYDGWGVQQHFMMGRVRAIETRRWLVRSVNRGIAGAVDDLGQPVQTLSRGEGALHVRPRLLGGETLYVRLGDLPALLLAGLMLVYAARIDRR
ncbi:apolipoprotein N-acyltransferase [Deinococcus metallilatus]|uniref:Apolipoprotein N-acyltransferase n=1 Tax=Deinococcus metallilatus TaxID=1211322 RepID=A0AAJ5F4T5_9DEIO|nr:apolipoprotein N-acyltransferase [Deinococcus metallilatus]MBB5294114.1 apolipoprotein N-acyltransferase [Deinococcus metallilatus]QBY08899.1 apolipoprotein N-acyltransferase [Deinococcus metallilatus]RXJ10043.1 apolipoprotein N-acyltransferase [Deinococcus metallilatus]TLK28020.1 apolipoprotein N-acyltransferase [Deinococcus metallilatus]GMA16550.1 apolipoprotein N-acyltransferase [Deinococcus metallilatus]